VAAASWGAPIAFPVRAEAATRTLVGADGAKVLLVGDAAWSLIAQLTPAETQQYLEDRRARGFNAVLVNLIEHHFAALAPANQAGQPPFLVAGDFTTPNGAYFDHAEFVVEQARQRAMAVLLAPMYLGFEGGEQGWYQELRSTSAANALAYGRYVGQRFAKYPNLIWVHGGDMAPTDVLPQINAIVAGIEEAGNIFLRTGHGMRGNSSLDDYNLPWLGLNSFYTDCAGAQTKARSEWLRGGTLPMLHIEGVYENEGASDECLLSQLYHTVLNGARGHVFGNRPIWLFDAGWPAALGSPGAGFAEQAADLFRSREGGTLVPDPAIVVGGAGTPGAADAIAAARTASGRTALVYVPTARTLQVDPARIPSPSSAWWYDPRTGGAQPIPGGGPSFTTPAGGPWVLVLDDPSVPSTPGAPAATRFFTLAPCRVADTRNAAGASGGPALGANTVRSFPAAGLCGIPSTAQAVAINLTVVDQTDFGNLRLFAAGGGTPSSSTINFAAGHVRANNAVIPLGVGGQISVQTDMPAGSTGRTHFLFDVTGYFE
jgi:hypothetical protein